MSAFLALSLVTLAGCRENESDLLEPKLYFESTENTIEVDNDAPKMAYDLQSRPDFVNASPKLRFVAR